jgi:metal-dependent amidase/aminoacylase/carboxypeptidase family protein
LRKAGFTVTERIGKYPDGTQAYGLVGILQNGPGPRLLIRADMDALPIIEETGVAYASHVKSKNAAGQEIGVMHACGHDVHVTTMIGTARALGAMRADWHGTGRKIPTLMFWLGAMDPVKLAAAQAAGKSLPGPHTSLFEPIPEPTLRTGVTAMTSVAIALLQ